MKTVDTESNNLPYIDPKDYYQEEMDSWEILWDKQKSLYQNVYNIVDQAVMLPQRDLMLPIVATYLLIPSKWARILPILFSWGGKGSGKSTISIIASKLHGFKQTFSATDTFSAIRNALDYMRWIDPIQKDLEKEGVILCWDNIHSGTLERDERIYQLLLFGYSRDSDKILIAAPGGENREFHVFSPKIISSVDDIHCMMQFEELHRRLIVIPHKPFHEFSSTEKKPYENFDIINDKLDIDSILWDGIEREFLKFWNNPDNCKLYAKYRTNLTKRGKREITHNIRAEQWLVSIDLITTGLVTGAWRNAKEAIIHMENYWIFANTYLFNQLGATVQHLKQFIEDEVGTQKLLNEKLIEVGAVPTRLRIDPTKLKKRLEYHRERGELDINPRPKDIIEIMSRLGWKLSSKGWEEKQ